MYTISRFVQTPDWCDVTYELSMSDPAVESMVVFDVEKLTFTFSQKDDLGLCGAEYTDYTITIKATIGNFATYRISDTAAFKLRLKNPCIDDKFVTIM